MIDDILWIRLIQSGNQVVFEHLYRSYFTPLCRFISLYIENKTEAEEITAELFIYVWEHRENIDFSLYLKSYLFQSAKNRALNYLRDKKQKVSIDILKENSDEHYNSEEELEFKELQNLIKEAVCQLPTKCQTIFKKSREEHKSNQEIADEMNISIKTVEAHITAALKSIRKKLGEKYYYLF